MIQYPFLLLLDLGLAVVVASGIFRFRNPGKHPKINNMMSVVACFVFLSLPYPILSDVVGFRPEFLPWQNLVGSWVIILAAILPFGYLLSLSFRRS